MIGITAPRTTARLVAATAAGFVGAVALAGCSSSPAGGSDAGSSSGDYVDGTYTAEGSYSTPESAETISVTVSLADGVITSVDVSGDPQKAESQRYQGQFIGGISDEVVGRSIDEISVSRVAGSSLTSDGFNRAIEQIKADAAG